MWDKVLEFAYTNGIWALLFCSLLVYQLKDSKSREMEYQHIIDDLSKDLGYMQSMDKSIDKIRQQMAVRLSA